MVSNTVDQYDAIVDGCRELFFKKIKDYGPSWRILRPSSVTDQIFIKAQRIRTVETSGENRVGEGLDSEFIGIINYCVIGIIQLELGESDNADIQEDQIKELYEDKVNNAKKLMLDKNHDYGEAWRDMRKSSLTDLILVKINRIKQIEDNAGQTLVSEGVEANYYDIINYAIFALIMMDEENHH